LIVRDEFVQEPLFVSAATHSEEILVHPAFQWKVQLQRKGTPSNPWQRTLPTCFWTYIPLDRLWCQIGHSGRRDPCDGQHPAGTKFCGPEWQKDVACYDQAEEVDGGIWTRANSEHASYPMISLIGLAGGRFVYGRT
jgi:hypothetical protein